MASRLRPSPAAQLAPALLPAEQGHAVRGLAPPRVPPDAIEAFADRVGSALRASRATRREHGFLAYAPLAPGAPLVPEEGAVGRSREIRWPWRHPDATVALSFHTHPGRRAACRPSGIDAVGAMIRGDHLVYVLTMDGRLSGWRFRAPGSHARAADEALRALDGAKRLHAGFVDFLYDAFDAMRADLMEPAYAARVSDDGARCRIERAEPDASFFREGEA